MYQDEDSQKWSNKIRQQLSATLESSSKKFWQDLQLSGILEFGIWKIELSININSLMNLDQWHSAPKTTNLRKLKTNKHWIQLQRWESSMGSAIQFKLKTHLSKLSLVYLSFLSLFILRLLPLCVWYDYFILFLHTPSKQNDF